MCEGDVTVDWIGNKTYISEQTSGRIIEYDLTTSETREVVNTGGIPVSLAVYPYPRQG